MKLTPIAFALLALPAYADDWYVLKNGQRLSGPWATSAICVEKARALKPPRKQYSCAAVAVVTDPPPVVPSWTPLAAEGASFTLKAPQIVRYGSGAAWIEKPIASTGVCSNGFFGSDPLVGVVKSCQLKAGPPIVIAPVPPVTDHHVGLTVNPETIPTPQPGVSTVLLSPPGAVPPARTGWEDGGDFRLLCNWSKMSYDDPIVYPGQPGLAHHHTFFGNTAIDANTTSANIRTKGNATCRGGTINLSGYWIPSLVDTRTNSVVKPRSLLIYYKTGFWVYMNANPPIKPLPTGLKMIAGDATLSGPGGVTHWSCLMEAQGYDRAGTYGSAIPPRCEVGDSLRGVVPFPQCWDGVNLDSPNHKAHMAYPINVPTTNLQRQYACPASHPVVLPAITFTVIWDVVGDLTKLRLSSDVYDATKPGGYSLHGDWLNGWDQAITDLWGQKCMAEKRDCGSANLGDGRVTLEFQGN